MGSIACYLRSQDTFRTDSVGDASTASGAATEGGSGAGAASSGGTTSAAASSNVESTEHGLTALSWNDSPFEPAKLVVCGYSKRVAIWTMVDISSGNSSSGSGAAPPARWKQVRRRRP